MSAGQSGGLFLLGIGVGILGRDDNTGVVKVTGFSMGSRI